MENGTPKITTQKWKKHEIYGGVADMQRRWEKAQFKIAQKNIIRM